MKVHNHRECDHADIEFCKKCQVVYCKDCGMEFKENGISVSWTPFNYNGSTWTNAYSTTSKCHGNKLEEND